MVVLHQNNPQDENALHLELEYDGELALEANLIEGNHTFLLANPSGWIMDQDWFDVSFFVRMHWIQWLILLVGEQRSSLYYKAL